MSVALMTAVWALDIASTDKIVLLALADNANDDGTCWPSLATICRKTSLSTRGVQSAIGRLKQMAHLSVRERSGHSNVFVVTPAPDAPLQDMHPAQDAPHPRTTCTPPPQDMRGTPAPRAPRTIIEPSTEPSRESSPEVAVVKLEPRAKEIQTVFEHWRITHGHLRAGLDEKRRKVIRDALKLYGEADLCQAISGYLNSPFHLGKNDRNTKFTDLEHFLGSPKKIDAGLTLYAEPPRTDLSDKTRKIIQQTEGWVPPELRNAKH